MNARDATPADAAAIDALFRESFTATFAHLYAAEDLASFFERFTVPGWAQELADPGFAFRVIEDGEGLAGYCKLGPISLPATPQGPAIELRQLYLRERAKGSGAAQALMDWALATARVRGATELWLSVYIDNHRAQRFYERYGFEDRGPYAFMVGNHADEDRLMRLAL
ncbi:N-acetyltransferase family protein [Sphingomonas sp. HT-1]|jgi:ribosomal protein S18 acetylase RimI-like enzyme|uniref:GNAT family N-acetyltransferase n=1 Tax=unclassified Sphingomonas TaxID=196159 RepID=UPI0003154179|nr:MULTISPECIES: GNAT family N-acetyltransferase [unclassified Sphingomonas]KTF70358.1 GCN5 family acetyltransferase [Sphingomonas sp. WG]